MKKVIIALGILVMCFTSCSDFLDPESKSEYIPREVASLNTLLIGYDNGSITSLLELLDDDVACQSIDIGKQDAWTKAFELFTWQPDYWAQFGGAGAEVSDNTYNTWYNMYEVILRINAVLDYVDDVDGTTEMRNYVKGQALGIRAYYYYLLVNSFAVPYTYNPNGLGVVLKLTSAVEPGGMARATVKESYDRIVKDLLDAEKCFENTTDANAYNMNYRMNLPTVRLLLSRVYLYMENWKAAREYASKVIESGRLLMLDFNNITFDPGYSHPNFHSYKNSEVMWAGSMYGLLQFRSQYSSSSKDNVTWYNTNWFRASDDLVKLYNKNDLRTERYLFRDSLPNGDGTFYYYYRPLAKIAISNTGVIMQGSQCYSSIRLVEAYVNRAEANAMLFAQGEGDKQVVLDDIEFIHTYRYRTGTAPELQAANTEDLIQLVRDERRREFCFENTRWFDLRRYGMPEIEHEWKESADRGTWKIYTLKLEDNGYTLPIPDKALEQNPKLEQNPLAPKREN